MSVLEFWIQTETVTHVNKREARITDNVQRPSVLSVVCLVMCEREVVSQLL